MASEENNDWPNPFDVITEHHIDDQPIFNFPSDINAMMFFTVHFLTTDGPTTVARGTSNHNTLTTFSTIYSRRSGEYCMVQYIKRTASATTS